MNITSCTDIPAVDSNTQTTACLNGYEYDYTLYGETTITTVSYAQCVIAKSEFADPESRNEAAIEYWVGYDVFQSDEGVSTF